MTMESVKPMNASTRPRFGVALVLAVMVDAVQIIGFSMFAEGALSPADDVLDSVAAVILVGLLGWHWEFLPSFLAELVPGVDLVPFWTLAVANVYRKWKKTELVDESKNPQVKIIDVVPQRPADENEHTPSGVSH